MTQYHNQARTIDQLIALLQQSRAAHGGDALVLMTQRDSNLAGPPSLQSGVALPLTVTESSDSKHKWRAENGYKSLRYGWNHDLPSAESGQGCDPLEQEQRYDSRAAVCVLLF